ncbi:MAG: UbiA family prenyltransferase [Gammaproteobacteria bacterium]|nr:UbiA family prenyltransferase [Gammaproteobacteria bacterium]
MISAGIGQRLPAVLLLLRPQQWSKNLLVAAPLLAAHLWHVPEYLYAVLILWLAFNALASAVYVFNDALDYHSDRLHPLKRKRPFASGVLPRSFTYWLVPLLLAVALLLLLNLPRSALLAALLYALLALCYCLWLKRVMWLDVMLLAALFTIRLIAGAAVVAVQLSPWLAAFSMFLFFSLATLKRYAELCATGVQSLDGRAYLAGDASLLQAFGVAAAMAAILVLALYVNSEQVELLYEQTAWLWLIGPILLYWLTRLWSMAQRGELLRDPLTFAIGDGVSWVCGGLILGCFVLAL